MTLIRERKYRIVSIDTLTLRIFLFLGRKIGYARVPKNVPLFFIAKGVQCTYDEARARIKKLIELGLLEKWTVYNKPKHQITYYRIAYPSKEEISNPKQKK